MYINKFYYKDGWKKVQISFAMYRIEMGCYIHTIFFINTCRLEYGWGWVGFELYSRSKPKST